MQEDTQSIFINEAILQDDPFESRKGQSIGVCPIQSKIYVSRMSRPEIYPTTMRVDSDHIPPVEIYSTGNS